MWDVVNGEKGFLNIDPFWHPHPLSYNLTFFQKQSPHINKKTRTNYIWPSLKFNAITLTTLQPGITCFFLVEDISIMLTILNFFLVKQFAVQGCTPYACRGI